MSSCDKLEDELASSNKVEVNKSLANFNSNSFIDTSDYPRGIEEFNSNVIICSSYLDSSQNEYYTHSRILGSCQSMSRNDTLFIELISTGFDTELLLLTVTMDTFELYHHSISCIKNDKLNFHISGATLTLNNRPDQISDTLIGKIDASFTKLNRTWTVLGHFKSVLNKNKR